MKTIITVEDYDKKHFQKVVDAYKELSRKLKDVAKVSGVWHTTEREKRR